MSRVEEFVCHPCGQWWHDIYSFWRGYQSPCPVCGKLCKAFCDTEAFADLKVLSEVNVIPLIEFEDGDLKTEADLEAERSQIHEEMVEALAAAEYGASGEIDEEEAGGDDNGSENEAGS